MFSDLTKLVQPKNIAIIGVSNKDGTHGKITYENIVYKSDYSADNVFLVNPKYDNIFNQKCYKSVGELKGKGIDVAIVLLKANLVADVVQQCADISIPFAIVMSSGFEEAGAKGKRIQKDLENVIQNTNIHVYGPNCPGLTDINRNLGMTFSPGFAHDKLGGEIGLVTQGGGLGRTTLQAQSRNIGFGYFFSPGNEIDLELADCIHHMLNDPKIKVVAAVAEGIKNGDKFKAVAKMALKKEKPIVILKVGRSELGQKAALSHTGSMVGSDKVFDALCHQYGVIRVNDVDELIETAYLFVRSKIKKNAGLAIVTGSGGSGSLLADYCGLHDLNIPSFKASTIEKLKEVLPSFASFNNPVDLTASFLVDNSIHTESMLPIIEDENIDIVVEPINANYGTSTEQLAESLINLQKGTVKTIIPIWISCMEEGGYKILVEGGLAPFRSIRNTVIALNHFTTYCNRLDGLKNSVLSAEKEVNDNGIRLFETQKILNEYESKKIIKQIGIKVPREKISKNRHEALVIARKIGYPVALKIVSKDIMHKTEVGGIKLNLENEQILNAAYDKLMINVKEMVPDAEIEGVLVSEMVGKGTELILGLKKDPQFGQTILIGTGGIYAEVFKDVAIGICPISKGYATELLNQLKIAPILKGYRDHAEYNLDELASVISNLSQTGYANQDIKELDVNPLVVKKGQAIALDALIVRN